MTSPNICLSLSQLCRMRPEIKDLMDNRRIMKNNGVQYNLVNREHQKVQSERRMARREMLRGRDAQSQS